MATSESSFILSFFSVQLFAEEVGKLFLATIEKLPGCVPPTDPLPPDYTSYNSFFLGLCFPIKFWCLLLWCICVWCSCWQVLRWRYQMIAITSMIKVHVKHKLMCPNSGPSSPKKLCFLHSYFLCNLHIDWIFLNLKSPLVQNLSLSLSRSL